MLLSNILVVSDLTLANTRRITAASNAY
jgi:hypothetical protein